MIIEAVLEVRSADEGHGHLESDVDLLEDLLLITDHMIDERGTLMIDGMVIGLEEGVAEVDRDEETQAVARAEKTTLATMILKQNHTKICKFRLECFRDLICSAASFSDVYQIPTTQRSFSHVQPSIETNKNDGT